MRAYYWAQPYAYSAYNWSASYVQYAYNGTVSYARSVYIYSYNRVMQYAIDNTEAIVDRIGAIAPGTTPNPSRPAYEAYVITWVRDNVLLEWPTD